MVKLELVPVKTKILTNKDDIVETIEKYAKDLIGPDDVISVAESVVAITQGRMVRPEELKPGMLARIMCRFVPQKGSMSSIYGMQAAMNAEGEWKMFGAMLTGMACKLIGKSGVFYQLAGKEAALVDDVTGTMPPFDKHIVYGPHDPHGVAERIKNTFGCYGAAVADVNDLKRAAVLGITNGLDPKQVAQILIDNPFGNASQQTPIVIIKNYAKIAAAQGSLE